MLEWCSRQANRQKHLTWVLQYDLDHFHELRPNISFDILIHLRVFHFYPSFYHSSFINAFIKLVIFTISLNMLKWRRRGVSPSKATAASLQLHDWRGSPVRKLPLSDDPGSPSWAPYWASVSLLSGACLHGQPCHDRISPPRLAWMTESLKSRWRK